MSGLLDHTDWPIFPDSSYGSSRSGEESVTSSSLCLPPADDLQNWVTDQVNNFANNGMRLCVGAVILAHRHLLPHLLLLHNSNRSSSILDDVITFQNSSIPLFEYRKWQTPVDVLQEQLTRMMHVRQDVCIEDFPEIFNLPDREPAAAPNVHSTPAPPTSQDSIEPDESDFMTDVTAANPSAETPFRSKENHKSQPVIGASLGLWWVAEFGHAPLPYLPAHITRPKVQIRLYQIILPPECQFVLPHPDVQLKFISFDSLSSSPTTLGPAYASIPLLVSRQSPKAMVARSVDVPSKSTMSSAHASRADLGRSLRISETLTPANSSCVEQNGVTTPASRISDQQAFVMSMQKLEEDTNDE